ncbi:MAG: D-sedoheptulose 7-phosphate isomerase [Candidatus Omnitrophica bacterium]|nr:D-sedoheptulose 7-phosphate isomerase [Candidatus Omnitrophota bacterium]
MTTKVQKIQKTVIGAIIESHEAAFRASFGLENIKLLQQMAEEISEAFKRGNKILLCGNGGSAADAQHIAAEFIGRFKKERKSLPAIALTTDTSILTALANDYGYDSVFSRQVEGLGQKGDILIALSTSGNSKNVIEAAQKAKDMGLSVFGFTGESGGELKKTVHFNFFAGAQKTPHVQEMHITALHAISEAVEDALFPA